MHPLIFAFVVGSAEPPSLSGTSVDGAGAVCSHLRDRFGELLLSHQRHFPSGTQIDVELAAEDTTISLTLLVEAPNEQGSHEVHNVNSCQEALDLLDFQLRVGHQPQVSSHSTSNTTEEAQVSTMTSSSEVRPSRVGVDVFSAGSTNYPNDFGVGVGGGLHVSFSRLRLEGYGVWMQPLDIVSPSADKADYSFSRADFGLLSRLNVLSGSIGLAPCLGLGIMRLVAPEEQLAPQANPSGHAWAMDAGVSLSMPFFAQSLLEGTLLFRYAWQTIELGSLAVGQFEPRAFEVNMRVGVSYDIFTQSEPVSGSPAFARASDGGTTWQ